MNSAVHTEEKRSVGTYTSYNYTSKTRDAQKAVLTFIAIGYSHNLFFPGER